MWMLLLKKEGKIIDNLNGWLISGVWDPFNQYLQKWLIFFALGRLLGIKTPLLRQAVVWEQVAGSGHLRKASELMTIGSWWQSERLWGNCKVVFAERFEVVTELIELKFRVYLIEIRCRLRCKQALLIQCLVLFALLRYPPLGFSWDAIVCLL